MFFGSMFIDVHHWSRLFFVLYLDKKWSLVPNAREVLVRNETVDLPFCSAFLLVDRVKCDVRLSSLQGNEILEAKRADSSLEHTCEMLEVVHSTQSNHHATYLEFVWHHVSSL